MFSCIQSICIDLEYSCCLLRYATNLRKNVNTKKPTLFIRILNTFSQSVL